MSWALAEFDAKEAGKKEGFAQGIAIGEQRGRTEGIAIGEQRGRIEAKLDTAKNAIKMGININQIVTLTGLSIEEIKELQQKME